MVFRGGRRGRPGLLGTVARTAVVAGTAKATSNAMDRRSQRKADDQQQEYQQQQAPPAQVAPVQSVPPSGADDLVSKLQELGQLHQSGLLTDAEFAAAKAQLLS
ncbi:MULTISPECIES: SHOCT domain-containing protein [Rhodococcus]|uniref:SHOCT domain-containing protein n=1 Tax=Rhodococcus TaxID=1827 RepID=UPI001E2CC1F3|nr:MULTISPECIES: SHOCT domain-containing protein [Rhodococcus]MCD2106563.1 SHOCT domain-containing protein [Rhodococcus qingshengii]MCZ4525558.1 SHOCT domain-containing protein [Rhodococcus erythropolis]MDV8004272.1 SHOCT domain-containing protein [Rhodococcus sp. IEGM 1318]